MATVKCIKCDVYRRARPLPHSPARGVSYRYDTLYLPHEQGPYRVDEHDPRIMRLERFAFPAHSFYAVEENPAPSADRTVGPEEGGNFLYGTYLFPCRKPVPIFDRWVTQAESEETW